MGWQNNEICVDRGGSGPPPTARASAATGQRGGRRFGATRAASSGREARSWVMVSRSRTVTVPSSRLWKSTVRQKGVPISSYRR